MSEHGGRLRESLPSTPRQMMVAIAVAFATALGGAVASLFSSWAGGIVTQAELDTALAKHAAQIKAIEDVRAGDRLKVLEDGDLERQRARALLVREIRVRVGLEAEVRVALDTHRKDQAERTAAFVRAKYDELILHQEEPLSAADKALESALLQR